MCLFVINPQELLHPFASSLQMSHETHFHDGRTAFINNDSCRLYSKLFENAHERVSVRIVSDDSTGKHLRP